jgi:hypothetical protein
MQTRLAHALIFIAFTGLARPALAAETVDAAPAATRADALVVLDYQRIPIRGYPSIDLAGVHVLNQFNDWLYGGVGAHAPLFKGEYGGFMSFDATLHAQAAVAGRLFADGGVSFGGGGGGNSIAQSRIISGSGAFIKEYAGLGWRFDDFSAGLDVSHIRFTQSVIHGTQLDFVVELPFSYPVGSYASTGRHFGGAHTDAGAKADDSTLMLGLDNFIQVKPKGTFKGAVNLADVQFNHFLDANAYALVEGSVGYRGLPIYNQLLGGIGWRAAVAPRLNLYTQVAVGSGGYDPQQFDTGPGLIVYPKVFGEYRLSDHVGLALSAGYLFAPRGTSRNLTVGAALNYHLAASGDGGHNGYRIDVFQQSELDPKIGDRTQGVIKLLTTQIDDVLDANVYVPIQASIAYSRFLGYPGYGEALTGLGLQTTHTADRPFQGFAQLVAGINVHGVIVKPAIGVNWGLSDRLALYAQAGKTYSMNVAHLYPERHRFNTTNVGLGLTYRFSLPG